MTHVDCCIGISNHYNQPWPMLYYVDDIIISLWPMPYYVDDIIISLGQCPTM